MKNRAKELYESGFGSLRKISEELGFSESTVKSWKKRDATEWLKPNKKDAPLLKKDAPRKKVKKVAENLIKEGYTLAEVSRKLEVPLGTVGRWSSEGNLMSSQLDNLKQFREQHRERIQRNKLKRLEINEKVLSELHYMEFEESVPKDFMSDLIKTEELEQKIFELDRIEKAEKLELEKQKFELEREKAKEENEESTATGWIIEYV
ncbi:MAG: terminase gpP N-terminus-related DNA-binding protein [Fusobacteriaceae bacterium]